ncbi:MAG TPA: YWFCY domain-containing protein [Puia sp.]|jgi:hypothetical protein
MNNNKDSLKGITDLCIAASIILLLLHIYFYFYPVFSDRGWETTITNQVLIELVKTGFFQKVYYSKGIALILVALSVFGSPVRKDPGVSVWVNIGLLGIGLTFYLCSMDFVPDWGHAGNLCCALYSLATLLGWILIHAGGTRLMRRLRLPWSNDDVFGRRRAGFPQEQGFRPSDVSLHLRGMYKWKDQKRKSWINLINPRRGILIMGSPGSGKSWFIIEPFIRQLIEKQFALFIYDFKYDALTKIAWAYFQANKHKYPVNTQFYSINFTDLSRSHRCNLLEASTLDYLSDALAASRTILLSMNKTWVNKQGDFFIESPINFLAALIWYLRKYKGGIYCTLPHVIELSKTRYDKLFKLLGTETEIATLIDPFVQAYANKSMEMLDAQISSAKIPLGRLSSPDLYYVLTGNDLSLDINDPSAPKIFCLGGDPSRIEALAPVISLYIDRLSRICNRPGRYPCAFVCDEFGTIRAYNMATIVATGRSNNIIPILAVQDVTQLRTQYSNEEADTLLNISGNFFCGQVGGATARWVSERFPKILQERSSVTSSSTDTAVSTSQQWEATVTQATVATLSSGEFLGITADEPGNELELKTFHAKIIREEKEMHCEELPVIQSVDATVLQEQYSKIKHDIENLVNEELGRIAKEEN